MVELDEDKGETPDQIMSYDGGARIVPVLKQDGMMKTVQELAMEIAQKDGECTYCKMGSCKQGGKRRGPANICPLPKKREPMILSMVKRIRNLGNREAERWPETQEFEGVAVSSVGDIIREAAMDCSVGKRTRKVEEKSR